MFHLGLPVAYPFLYNSEKYIKVTSSSGSKAYGTGGKGATTSAFLGKIKFEYMYVTCTTNSQ